MNAKIGKVSIPLFAVVAAIPKAIKAAAAVASDDRTTDSPGGVKVTPGEVTEAIFAFVAKLAEEISGPILKANGLG